MVVWVVSWYSWFTVNGNGNFGMVYWHYSLVGINGSFGNNWFWQVNWRFYNSFLYIDWSCRSIMTASASVCDSIRGFATDMFIIPFMSIVRFMMAWATVTVASMLIVSSVQFVAVLVIVTSILNRRSLNLDEQRWGYYYK